MDSLTVVIPTFNRAPVLKKALEAYLTQGAPEGIYELLVVDDGSTDETQSVVDEISCRAPFAVRYFRQENRGPAAARNVGIREARADIILFTDSDIVPHQDLVQQHLEWHERNPEITSAVLGYVTWPPELAPTPFMRWYGEQGALFAYGKFSAGQQLTFLDFYTCNLSLKTAFLRTCGQFDEEFKSAAYEDIELGYRLSKAGLRLLYGAGAVGYHHQYFFFNDVCGKARRNAASERVFRGKEAGQRVLEQQRNQKSGLGYRVWRVIAIGAGVILSPFQNVLDSRVPLPSVIYRLLLWYNIARSSSPPESPERA
jgi:glycosyltransferase involved in cell wall biosynthesis